ncbi:hypothetical protein QUW44_09605 [Limosilactobacillus pontis]|uniref:Uncharacterized protein n=1 Tax=Limosilactobacillus pontis TaxID=35787 RepID=A0ABT7V231_9LACO|nr:hypothetical protein [Limosilactobacillus pontis]MDM8267365.1 hypothetical protein [Limosilactobacillus pontis]MDM8332526.1 hypothetical protein [Limosilactobacillus pontis]
MKQITFLADRKTQAKLAYINAFYHSGGLDKKSRTRAETLRAIIDEVYSNLANETMAYTQFLPPEEKRNNHDF